MCKPASFVVVKGEPPKWSKYSDSHEVIRKEHNLPHNTDTRIVNVQVEITPPDGDMTRPIKEWTFATDQDRFPAWWDAKAAESEVRKELKTWIAQKVITKNCAELRDGEYYVIGAKIESVSDSATVITNTAINPACLKSSRAVIIDRRNPVAKCYVGNKEVRAKKR